MFSFTLFYFIDAWFHIFILMILIRGIKYGSRIKILEKKTIARIDDSFVDIFESKYEDVGEETSQYLRRNEPKGCVLISTNYKGLDIVVKRRKGLTELIINGKVYDEKKGIF